MINLTPGEVLPQFDNWRNQLQKFKFYRASFAGGEDYVDSYDARGKPVLSRHPAETTDGYIRRKDTAVLYNYVKPIINRYNDLIYAIKPVRYDSELFEQFYNNVDGYNTDIDEFYKNVLKHAQIDGRSFVIPELNTDSLPSMGSVSQLQPILKEIRATGVPYYIEAGQNVVVHAFILHSTNYATEIDDVNYRNIKLSDHDSLVIEEIGETQPHGFGQCPLVMAQPYDSGSQSSGIAALQNSIFNYTSLLKEELYNSTFTMHILSGCDEGDTAGIRKGPARLMIVNKENIGVHSLGSDTSQAESIRRSIKDEINELYRTAGVTSGNAIEAGQVMSGVAHAFMQQATVTHALALSKSIQQVESRIMNMIASVYNVKDYELPSYSKDYNPTDLETDLNRIIDVSKSEIPNILKTALYREFAKENLSLSENEQRLIDTESNI